jgi:hypothetical protein
VTQMRDLGMLVGKFFIKTCTERKKETKTAPLTRQAVLRIAIKHPSKILADHEIRTRVFRLLAKSFR